MESNIEAKTNAIPTCEGEIRRVTAYAHERAEECKHNDESDMRERDGERESESHCKTKKECEHEDECENQNDPDFDEEIRRET